MRSLKDLRLFLREARQTFKQEGLPGVVRRYGWKIVVAIFLIYLVRDVVLYLLLPWLLIVEFV